MAQKKSLTDIKKDLQKKMKNVNARIKKEKDKLPLNFCKDLEKLFNAKFEKKHYDIILDLIKTNKSAFETKLKPTTTTTNASAKPTTPTPQAKPTTSTTNYNSYKK